MNDNETLIIPANIEAERAVLGSLLIDADTVPKVAAILKTPKDFFLERHGWLYGAILLLWAERKPIDYITVVDQLEANGQLENLGGPAYIMELINATPTSVNAEHYAAIVRKTANKRQLIAAAGKIASLAYDDQVDDEDAIEQAESLIFAVGQGQMDYEPKPIRDILMPTVDQIDYLARHQNMLMGVPTSFTLLDRMLGGLQKSDLIIVAGRPGMGKSALAMTIANNAAKKYGAHVAIFSLEMSNEQLAQRMLSMETGIDSHRLRLGQVHEDEWELLLNAANQMAQTTMFIDDTPAASVHEIRSKCLRLHAEHGLDMVLIDYMQLMSGVGSSGRSQENRQQEISYISRNLKALARTQRAGARTEPTQPSRRKQSRQAPGALRPARERPDRSRCRRRFVPLSRGLLHRRQ